MGTRRQGVITFLPNLLNWVQLYFVQTLATTLINWSICTETFPTLLKKADVTPVYKKNGRLEIGKYHSISVLPCLSKIFDQLYIIYLHLLTSYGFCLRKSHHPTFQGLKNVAVEAYSHML